MLRIVRQPPGIMSLTPKQIEVLESWYLIQKDTLPTLLYSLGKYSLIIHNEEGKYHLTQKESESILTLLDLLNQLEKHSV